MQQLFNNVSMSSIAHVDAPVVISSAEIEDKLSATMARLGIRKGLLQSLSGIKERRFWDKDIQPSDAATQAARLALDKANIDKEHIGALINTSVCRDYIEPSTACLVHGNLKLSPSCLNYDLGNACLGFMNGMDVVAQLIENGAIEHALIVDGESSRYPVAQTIERLSDLECTDLDFRSQFATLTLGSGAAAMVLSRRKENDGLPKYMGGVSYAATEYSRICLGQPDKMTADTRELLMRGLELAAKTFAQAKEVLNWGTQMLDVLVLHQVSKVHTEQLAALLNLDLEKVHRIYPEFGNIGPAAVPIVLSKAMEAGRVKQGSKVALMGIGSGLNCSMAEIQF